MYITTEPTFTMVSFDDDSLVLNFPKSGDVIQLTWSNNVKQTDQFQKMDLTFVCEDYADNKSRLKEAQQLLESRDFVALEQLIIDFYNSVPKEYR